MGPKRIDTGTIMMILAMQKRLLALAIVILGVLTGCGFQMVGRPLPADANRIYLKTTSPYSEFARSLDKRVIERGGVLVSRPAEADVVLTIVDDSTGQRVLSVSARNIPREYEIFYVLQFSIEAPDNSPLVPVQVIDLQRSYTYDETQVLGKRNEETVLREALADDLVRQVLRRVESLLSAIQADHAQRSGCW